MHLPRNLADVADEPERAEFFARLPAEIDEMRERWSIAELGAPYEPGGVASWVAPARTADGRAVTLKLGWQHDEALHEAEGLRFWNGDGAIRVHASASNDLFAVLLLESCVPGTTLAAALPPDERDVVLAGLLRRLWREPSPEDPFRPLARMCEAWADEFEQGYAEYGSRECDGDRIDPGLARAGVALMRELPTTGVQNVLLCTDLHPENILAAQREPWLVIDPKPYVGDPTYDVVQHILDSGAQPDHVDRMASLLDLDRDRLRLWVFARCVQESLNFPELGVAAARYWP